MPTIPKKQLDRFFLGISIVSGICQIIDFVFVDLPQGVRIGTGWALGLGLLYFIIGFLATRFRVWLDKKIEEKVQELSLVSEEPTTRDLFELSTKLYTVAYESLAIEGIVSEEGAMSIKREIKLRANSEGVSEIDHYLLAPVAPGDDDVQAVDLRSRTRHMELSKEVVKQDPNNLCLIVHMKPELIRGQVIEYTLEEKVPDGSIALSRKQAASRGLDYEYFAWDMSRPTRSLQLKVFLPKGLRPETPTYDVWYGVGYSHSTNATEHNRIRNGWSEEEEGPNLVYKLGVEYPMIGHSYVIKWIPPTNGSARGR